MKIRIVLAPQNAGWVIGKMATRLTKELQLLGHETDLSPHPNPLADINHWMSFAFAPGEPNSINTMFVTHVDDPFKVSLIKGRLDGPIQMALCMSPHATQELIELGIPARKIWHVLPAIDSQIARRRIRIGITTRTYSDGRKREKFLSRLAHEMPLNQFQFEIFGSGWDSVIKDLKAAGATVQYDPGSDDWQGDYAKIVAAVKNFDYYLYLGMDEGSLGTLDAHSAGIKTIVTAQGFHLSIPGGITHPFIEYQSLKEIFMKLASENELAAHQLSQWTWHNYAREHALIWEAMLRQPDHIIPEAQLDSITRRETKPLAISHSSNGTIKQAQFRLRALSPRRLFGAMARHKWLQPLRNKLRM